MLTNTQTQLKTHTATQLAVWVVKTDNNGVTIKW